MDMDGKTNDSVKGRMDLKCYSGRKEFKLKELANGKIVKRKAKFTFSMEPKRAVYQWMMDLRMSDNY